MEPTILGDYRLIKRIAKGGMGEVYQAYDTRCRRYVALKKIREDLKNYQGIRKRFLAEAHIAASLTHPAIVPIFTIHATEDPLYYTMPLLEGQSLKSLILQARKDPHLLSMSKLINIFLTVSQGIAHAHSRGFLHRDIKAENIWIGPCQEAVILDWGVAKSVSDIHDETLSEIWSEMQEHEDSPSGENEKGDLHSSTGLPQKIGPATINQVTDSDRTGIESSKEPIHQLTRPGKVVGTLSYMAPERALKSQVSYASDIYSLGVLLYFMLTLHLPFRRKSLSDYVKIAKQESYIDPRTCAPFRDIPKDLARVVERCLKFESSERYLTVQDLISDLQLFLQAGSDWVQHAELQPLRDKDWIAKEWVYLTTPVAQSELLHPEPMGWVTRMISRASFEGNLKVRMEIKPKDDVNGLGLLLCAPEQETSHRSLDGYCLWIGGERSSGGQLLRNGVMVLDLPGFCLRAGVTHQLIVECLGGVLHCYFDHVPKVTYVSYLPLVGSHVGLVVAKGHFDFMRVHVFGGKHSLQVSCLAVPDAFLSQKMYRQALAEYRRIGQSFFDYLEGRQAIFRAGITLIEWARQRPEGAGASELLDYASSEFEKLKGTLSAPLEWLGKSLVYREMGQEQEEINALELACSRFSNHPLINWLHEEVVFRLHEHASGNLKLSCRIVLLIVRALPQFMQRRDVLSRVRQILAQLPVTSFWQSPENNDTCGTQAVNATLEGVAIRMGYFLSDARTIMSVCRTLLNQARLAPSIQARLLQNAFYALLYLQSNIEANDLLELIREHPQLPVRLDLLEAAIKEHWPGMWQQRFALGYSEQRLIGWLLECEARAVMSGSCSLQTIYALSDALISCQLDPEQAEGLLPKLGWLLLAAQVIKNSQRATVVIDPHVPSKPLDHYIQNWWQVCQTYWPNMDSSQLQFLRACYLFKENKKQEGFELLSHLQALPSHHPLALLEAWLHHRLLNLQSWIDKALDCERTDLLCYGWLALHSCHPYEIASQYFEQLEKGRSYAGTNIHK